MAESRGMLVSELLSEWIVVPASLDRPVLGIHQDSREVTPGSLFLALPGSRQDGRQFGEQAIAAGASVVVQEGAVPAVNQVGAALQVQMPNVVAMAGRIASRFHGDPSRQLHIVGVTGTNGKSSVTHFVAQLGNALGLRSAVVGTLGFGVPGHLTPGRHTTPGCVELQQILRNLVDSGVELVAMEVSSHALDQYRVAGVAFDVAVLTNISQDHLDYHGTMDNYAAAKHRLLQWEGLSARVLNLDDPYGRQWSTEGGAGRVIRFGQTAEADLRWEVTSHALQGLQIQVTEGGRARDASVSLLGDFNASNLMAASAALVGIGFPLDQVLARVEAVTPVVGRLQTVALGDGVRAVIDYAHTPDALEKTLEALRLHCRGALWCVFGCGGDRDPGKRGMMGRIAGRLADHVLVTDDNPRSEDPDDIARAVVAGCEDPARVEIVRPRERAILQALKQARPDDWVLLAGKGHEDYQEIQGVRYRFSDQAMVQACWQALSGQSGSLPEAVMTEVSGS